MTTTIPLHLVYSLLSLCSVLAFFVALAWAIALWWQATLYRRLQPHFYWAFYPLLVVSNLIYLWRMAFTSFRRYGRRPANPFWGFTYLGHFFEWKHRVYDEEVIWRSHRMPQYFDWWVVSANTLLYESWLLEQEVNVFFRWGAFSRYLFLWFYYTSASLGHLGGRWLTAFFGSELGHSLLLFALRFGVLLLPWLTRPLWWFGRLASRFPFVMGGEFYVMLLFRWLRLEPLFRFQWFQRGNVEYPDYPQQVHQKSPALWFLRTLWFGNRQLAGSGGGLYYASAHFQVILAFLALLWLSFLLMPFVLACLLITGGYWFLDRFYRFHYNLWLTVLDRLRLSPLFYFEELFMGVFGSLFLALFSLLAVGSSLPALLVRLTVGLVRYLGGGVAFVFLAGCFGCLAVFDLQPLFRFGFGSIFLSFAGDLSTVFFPLVQQPLHLLSSDQQFSFDTLDELRTEFYDDIAYVKGVAYHGGWWYGYPLRKMPHTQVRWWNRLENFWYWDHPTASVALDSLRRSFLADFHKVLYRHATQAEYFANFLHVAVVRWWTMSEDWDNLRELIWRHPTLGIKLFIFEKYWAFSYRYLYCNDAFYWYRFGRKNGFYSLCFFLSAFLEIAVAWPIYRFWWMFRYFALFFPPALSWILGSLLRGSLSFAAAFATFRKQTLDQIAFFALLAQPFVDEFSLDWRAPFRYFFGASPVVYLLRHRWASALAGLWNLFGGWWLWYASIFYEEFFRWSCWIDFFYFLRRRDPSCSLILARSTHLATLSFWWPSLPRLEERGFSIWILALSSYIWTQQFWDSLYLPLELPRYLDDYTQTFRHRRFKRAYLYVRQFSTIVRGAFGANRRWALSPVILFRYGTEYYDQTIDRFMPDQFFFTTDTIPANWLSPVVRQSALFRGGRQSLLPYQEVMTVTLRYLPFMLVDVFQALLALLPMLYFVALLLFIGLFRGAPALLFDRVDNVRSTEDLFNRQWAWQACRFEQSTADLERFFLRRRTPMLRALHVQTASPASSLARAYARLLDERQLALQNWQAAPDTLISFLLYGRSISGGAAFFVRRVRSQRWLVIPFANYLLRPKYANLQVNYTDYAMDFLRFTAFFYSQNAWVRRFWNDYDEDDHAYWLPDVSLEVAERLSQAGVTIRDRLERVDHLLFQRQLGAWLWPKDAGTHELQKIDNPDFWGPLAYIVDDKDREAYAPWGPLFWFLMFPYYLYTNIYLHLEVSWNEWSLFGAAGTHEILRSVLVYHTILGHIHMFYEQMDMAGWYHVAEWQKSDTPITPVLDVPVNGYTYRWHKGYASSFYPVAVHWYHWEVGPMLFRGTAQPVGLLEEYVWGRRGLYLVLLALLPWACRKAIPFSDRWSSIKALRGRWSVYTTQINSILKQSLWFWK